MDETREQKIDRALDEIEKAHVNLNAMWVSLMDATTKVAGIITILNRMRLILREERDDELE